MDIALALGGGGAKGNAHLGVLKVLEREGFRIRALAGTSMGGLIGAVYLSGWSPEEIEARFAALDQRKLYGRERASQPSLLGLRGVTEALVEMVGEKTFDDLPVPFAVTAVDLNTGIGVVIKQGRLVDAVLATAAVPGIFPAREWGNFLLVDGGVLNPVPVNVARALAPKLPVVAVALNQPPEPSRTLPRINYLTPLPMFERIARLRVAQAFNVFVRSVDISGQLLAELRLKVDKPDIVIRPDVAGIGLLDRVEVPHIVRLGEEAAEAALPDLHQLVSWPARLARRTGVGRLYSRLVVEKENEP